MTSNLNASALCVLNLGYTGLQRLLQRLLTRHPTRPYNDLRRYGSYEDLTGPRMLYKAGLIISRFDAKMQV